MATDQGPMYICRDTGEFVWYYGWYDHTTGEMLELSKSGFQGYYQQYNYDLGAFYAFLGPGFTQKWGALGYFIRPEYLDRFSAYRPQWLNEGNVPLPLEMGQHDL